ncbi:MAG: hypothetical protein ACJAYK_002571 [Crocinitomicaceae bacterium]|jgi:uncharacterized protein YciI
MSGHKEWIKIGIEQDRFLIVASIEPASGGAIIARANSLKEIERIVDSDPFVINDVVKPEVIEISPSMTSKELEFLIGT